MISYEDREKYYTELTSLEEFYKESTLWKDIVNAIESNGLYNPKVCKFSLLELLNEARFACIRIYSDDDPLLYFSDKYFYPAQKRFGKKMAYLCHAMLYVLLSSSIPDMRFRELVIDTLRSTLEDRSLQFIRPFILFFRKSCVYFYNVPELKRKEKEAPSELGKTDGKTSPCKTPVQCAIDSLMLMIQEEKAAEIAKLKEEYEAELQKSKLNVEGLAATVKDLKSQIKKLLQKQTELTQELKSVNAELKAKSEIPVLPLDIFVQEANACEEKEDVVEILAVMDKLKTVLHDDHLTAFDKVIRKVKKIKTEKAKKAREEERASSKGGVTAGGPNSGIMAGGNIGVSLSREGERELIKGITYKRK